MTAREAYDAGLRGGPPPSSRFDALNGPRELLTPLVSLSLGYIVRHATAVPGDIWCHSWRHLVAALDLTAAESAFLLGLWHDAEPDGEKRIPYTALNPEC